MSRVVRLTRNVRRETAVVVQGRELMADLGKYTLTLRKKGKRKDKYTVPLEAIYMLGAKLARRAEDAAAKRAVVSVKRGPSR